MKWQSASCSVQGYAHLLHNQPCQDAFCISSFDDCLIAAVADGHGSAACPFSADGSAIAASIFCSLLKSLIQQPDREDTVSFLRRNGSLWLPRKIQSEWNQRVRLRHQLRFRSSASSDQELYHMYGTTLIGLAACDDFVFVLQIGDGDIAVCRQQKLFYPFIREQQLGVETASLCHSGIEKAARSVLFPDFMSEDMVFILSTDGFFNSHATSADYETSCLAYADLVKSHGYPFLQQQLKPWLDETSRDGCGDDITLLLAGY